MANWYTRNNVNAAKWRRFRLTILERDNYRCTLCGKAGRLEIDHHTPLEYGGDVFGESNCRALCRPCHFGVTKEQNRGRGYSQERKDWQVLIKASLK